MEVIKAERKIRASRREATLGETERNLILKAKKEEEEKKERALVALKTFLDAERNKK